MSVNDEVEGSSEKPSTWDKQSADVSPAPPTRQRYPIHFGQLVGCHKLKSADNPYKLMNFCKLLSMTYCRSKESNT